MARDNRLWGAERIWGELLKGGIRVSKGTIQKHMRRARKCQDSERKRAVARVSLRWPLPDDPYAACNTAHTSPHRSWNRRR